MGAMLFCTQDQNRAYTVKVKPIPDGTYFVRNPASERYLQIDNDTSSNNYSTSGAAMEQWYYTGGNYQKWTFTFRGDGYYSIINSQSGLALSVPSGQTGSTNVNLVQETYYGYERQKWSITRTDSGYYKIKPKSASSDLVMAVGSSDVSVVDGVKIQQRTYTNDTTYIDEWLLYALGPDAFLLGVNAAESGHDHHSIQSSILPALYSLGYDSFNCVVTDSISLTDTQNHLAACEVFVSRSHGGSDSSGTFICLDKNATIYLGTSQIYNFSTNTAVVNLSNCDLAIFVGCQTAAVEGTSLPDAAVAAGAQYAIGFPESIGCGAANEWTEYFFQYYLQGYSVQTSAQAAADKCSITCRVVFD